MALAPDTILSRNADILHASSGAESSVMMSLDAGKYFSVEGVAFRVWELLDEPRSVAEIANLLRREFAVDAATCEADVAEFGQTLLDHGIIEAAAA